MLHRISGPNTPQTIQQPEGLLQPIPSRPHTAERSTLMSAAQSRESSLCSWIVEKVRSFFAWLTSCFSRSSTPQTRVDVVPQPPQVIEPPRLPERNPATVETPPPAVTLEPTPPAVIPEPIEELDAAHPVRLMQAERERLLQEIGAAVNARGLETDPTLIQRHDAIIGTKEILAALLLLRQKTARGLTYANLPPNEATRMRACDTALDERYRTEETAMRRQLEQLQDATTPLPDQSTWSIRDMATRVTIANDMNYIVLDDDDLRNIEHNIGLSYDAVVTALQQNGLPDQTRIILQRLAEIYLPVLESLILAAPPRDDAESEQRMHTWDEQKRTYFISVYDQLVALNNLTAESNEPPITDADNVNLIENRVHDLGTTLLLAPLDEDDAANATGNKTRELLRLLRAEFHRIADTVDAATFPPVAIARAQNTPQAAPPAITQNDLLRSISESRLRLLEKLRTYIVPSRAGQNSAAVLSGERELVPLRLELQTYLTMLQNLPAN